MDIPLPEPLHPQTWFERLQRLADAIEDLDGFDADALIRQAYHIVCLTPAPLRHLFRASFSEMELEALLKCNAHESAIFGLLGPPLALTISRKLHAEEVSATIAIDDEEVCGSGAHSDVAMAGLSAWTKCLIKLSEVARNDAHASNPA